MFSSCREIYDQNDEGWMGCKMSQQLKVLAEFHLGPTCWRERTYSHKSSPALPKCTVACTPL